MAWGMKMKKIGIHKKWRKLILGLSILIFLLAGLMAFRELTVKRYEMVERELLDYSIVPNLHLKFNLIPNIIYEKPYLIESDIIIDKMVSSLVAEPQFEIQTQKGEKIQGTIRLEQKLETFYGSENILIWTKKAMPKESLLSGGKEIQYKAKDLLNLQYFNDFLAQAMAETEISGNSLYTATWHIQGTVSSQGQEMPIDEQFAVSLPLGIGIYTVDKSQFEAVNRNLTTTEKQLMPRRIALGGILGGVSALALIGAIVLLMLSDNKPALSAFQSYKKQLIANYGERLVELGQRRQIGLEEGIHVKTMEDMIKVADEIRQPIFYAETHGSDTDKLEFYIWDSHKIYYWFYEEACEESMEARLVDKEDCDEKKQKDNDGADHGAYGDGSRL